MFNKPGKLLKQQKILSSQNEHNLTILCEFTLGILLFFLLVSVLFVLIKMKVTAKSCSVNLVLIYDFFLYKIESGINIYRFFNDKVTIFRLERHLFQRKHKWIIAQQIRNIKTLNITFIEHWTIAELVLGITRLGITLE